MKNGLNVTSEIFLAHRNFKDSLSLKAFCCNISGLIFYYTEILLLKVAMKDKIYPPDQAKVLFTDVKGVRREGIYVMDMNAYVESIEYSDIQDCTNIFMESEIVQWEFPEVENSDSEFITVL